MKEARFIREFSKEKSQNERDALAKDIRVRRKDAFGERVKNEESLENEKTFESKSISALREKSELIEREMERLRELKGQIEGISESFPKKIFGYFKSKRLREDMGIGEKDVERLKFEADSIKEKILESKSKIGELESKDSSLEWKNIALLVDDFYRNQEKKWAESDFTKDDITHYFAEEYLSSLSISDYALLMQRFPSEMVTHVTRQGVRDHVGMMYHTAGAGVYSEGFKSIVGDGRLRSPLGVYLTENKKEEKILEYLHKYFPPENFDSKSDFINAVVAQFSPNLQSGVPGSYSDRMAIHFAAEEVADKFYGSERENEIFLTFPANLIASQYYFSGALNQKGGGYWNDQWVWANEEKGISVDAGIVFIPKDTPVNPETGSRYELNERFEPIVDDDRLNVVRAFMTNSNFEKFCKEALPILGKLPYGIRARDNEETRQLSETLEHEFGISEEHMQNFLLDYQTLISFQIESNNTERLEENIKELLKDAGMYFRGAKNPVSSQMYWESYFKDHPNNRPSKVVYYAEKDPTIALIQWKIKNKLIKKSDDYTMGFRERAVERDSAEATSGIGRFSSIVLKIAEKIPEEEFGSVSLNKKEDLMTHPGIEPTEKKRGF